MKLISAATRGYSIRVQLAILSWKDEAELAAWAHYVWQILELSLWPFFPWVFLCYFLRCFLLAGSQSIVILSVQRISLHLPSFSWPFPILRLQCSPPDPLSSHLPTNLSNSKNPSFCMVCRRRVNFGSPPNYFFPPDLTSDSPPDTCFIMISAVYFQTLLPPWSTCTPTCYSNPPHHYSEAIIAVVATSSSIFA